MSTYTELRSLFNNDELRNRCTIAIAVAAHGIVQGAPTLDEQRWAASVLQSGEREGGKALLYVLAANKDATVAQITGSTDLALQNQVDSVVPALVAALAADNTTPA